MKPLGPTSVRIWITPASDQDPWKKLAALFTQRPVDQARWSFAARVEDGRLHADLFWREVEGAGDGVKLATLTVSRSEGEDRLLLEVFVERAERMVVAGPTAQVLGRVISSALDLAMVPPRPAGPA